MDSPEFLIIALNFFIVLTAYLIVYPKYAGNDFKKISYNDIVASGVALLIVGSRYWNSEYEFTLLFFKVNWFWYTLITYAVIEFPIMVWYLKKNNVVIKLEDPEEE